MLGHCKLKLASPRRYHCLAAYFSVNKRLLRQKTGGACFQNSSPRRPIIVVGHCSRLLLLRRACGASCIRLAEKTENAKKLDQKQQFSSFQWEIFLFLAAKKQTFLGGVSLQNWLASDHPGAYTSMPHRFFGANKDVCYIEKKVAK